MVISKINLFRTNKRALLNILDFSFLDEYKKSNSFKLIAFLTGILSAIKQRFIFPYQPHY